MLLSFAASHVDANLPSFLLPFSESVQLSQPIYIFPSLCFYQFNEPDFFTEAVSILGNKI